MTTLLRAFRLPAASALAAEADGLVLVRSALTPAAAWSSAQPAGALAALAGAWPAALPAVSALIAADRTAEKGAALAVAHGVPGSRIVLSPVAGVLGDTDDVRRFADAARAASARARAAGMRRPAVVLLDDPVDATAGKPAAARVARDFGRTLEAVLLGLLDDAYVPLQAREHAAANGRPAEPFDAVHVAVASGAAHANHALVERAASWAAAVEAGRRVARDMGGADPERMAPLRCAEYIRAAFKDAPNVAVTVVTDPAVLGKEYPLLNAVARCSYAVPAHHPAVVRLEYRAPDQSKVKENLFFVGKGVTYDTGGADVKTDGHMRGMSRDKCGATACAGFLRTVSLLKPEHVNVTATLGFVRNSIGAGSYVSDEILLSRAGVRVLVGNTDAEGRMVMTDLLAEAKERALSPEFGSAPSRLFTVATLTGHAVLSVGEGYSISLDNGPARESGVSGRLFKAGHVIGDPFETTTLRREDYDLIQPSGVTEDVCQANSAPSSRTPRGHQYPAAFMSIASGIVNHGLDADKPVSYTHVDIAGSAEKSIGGLSLARVTGAPVAAFTEAFLSRF
ncbi:hypothetical protein HK105_200901 [Polyrhizophydium stewartii]|uniref:Cytosol aminopeptidase domain-containing protein n=1 Tax=Polyrhizophydium stewartii TaxID=2732419 RepID=A0ABR4NIA3_9FUNG|nr:Cytosol aminopeptidase, catalytic domain [Polyrhizophydium stewartii]